MGKPGSRNMQAREIEATQNALKKQGKKTESREGFIPAVSVLVSAETELTLFL